MLTWRGSRRISGPRDWNAADEAHRTPRVLAAERAVKPAKRVRLGDALAALGRKVRLTDEDLSALHQTRDKIAGKADEV
jgi:plasmid stability protein